MSIIEFPDLLRIKEVQKNLQQHPELCTTTPVLYRVETMFQDVLTVPCTVSLKLESMQCTGSFKVRGVMNQFLCLLEEDRQNRRHLVTMSAGNYGKAFAVIAKSQGFPATVCMPDNSPKERVKLIESYGAEVVLCPKADLLLNVRSLVKNGCLFLHSFDDVDLICGHASMGLELVEQLSRQPDIIVVPCGGGGLLAGVAMAVRLSGWVDTKIYGVEPEVARTMYDKFTNTSGGDLSKETIALGLAPPFAGEICYEFARKYADGIILVSEEDIKRGVSCLYDACLVAEPSGAAGFGALISGKIPDCNGKDISVVITGGNVTPCHLSNLFQEPLDAKKSSS